MRHAPPVRCCFRLFQLLVLWLATCAWAQPALPLPGDADGPIDAWSAITVFGDRDGQLSADQVLQRLGDFRPPEGPHANLALRRDVVWLHLPLQAVGGDGRWVLEIDYPPLNRVDVVLLRDGRPVAQYRLGNATPADQRPMRSRAHAVDLQLEPGVSQAVLLRVQTETAMVLPVNLSRPAAYHLREAGLHLMHGLMAGVALALLVYSLVHWTSLRDAVFLDYALIVTGMLVFFVGYTGIGQQHLWSQQTGLLAKVSPLGILLALVGGGRFIAGTLDTRVRAPRAHRWLLGVSVLALCGLMASMAGLLDYRTTQALATLMGPLPMLLAVGLALRLARRGDRMAQFILLGWLPYVGGALAITAMLRGLLPVNFWTLHALEFSFMLELLVWTRVLGLRIAAIRLEAERAALERSTLLTLAHTDALTGLPNRRGLQQALTVALGDSRADSALAVYLLDLDGFKPVNDRLGHDVGDALLVQVAQRLRQQVRHGDLVARLGGDEFVIMAPHMPGEAEAMALGRKLLAAFGQPFTADGHACQVGLTIGFALAPHDGSHAEDLLKRADAAMYAGKQAGRHTIRRGGAGPGMTFSG